MSKNKITLYYGMSINELNQFFAGLDDTTKVRARDLGGGKIQLYVRKDTFKHFFTDKLRLGFLVEHDYSKAIDRIKEIVNDRISTKSIKYADEQKSAYEELKKHTHDFSASTLKQHLTRLAEQEKKQIRAKANLNSGFPSRAYFSDSVRQILRETESIKKTEQFIRSFAAPEESKKISDETENFFNYSDRIFSYEHQYLPSVDYEAARDFAYTWLSAIEEEEKIEKLPNTPSRTMPPLGSNLKKTLTEICQRIVQNAKDQELGSKDKQSSGHTRIC